MPSLKVLNCDTEMAFLTFFHINGHTPLSFCGLCVQDNLKSMIRLKHS